MEAVAVYSDADADAPHVRLADVAVRIGPPPPAESYLRIDAIIDAARATGAEAIHPGYGFLAERAAFARAVEDAGLVFVGPPSDAIEALGDKLARPADCARSVGVAGGARDARAGAGRPARPGRGDRRRGRARSASRCWSRRRPAAAVAGCAASTTPADLPAALAGGVARGGVGVRRRLGLPRARDRARRATSRSSCSATRTGRVVAIGERDCSLQRRHQKLVEEAPAPGPDRRASAATLHDAGGPGRDGGRPAERGDGRVPARRRTGRSTSSRSTPGSRSSTASPSSCRGLDIVREQFWLAAGRPLSAEAARPPPSGRPSPTGHAIEVRIAAEDPSRDFAPTPGRVRRWVMPAGPGRPGRHRASRPATGSRPSTTT